VAKVHLDTYVIAVRNKGTVMASSYGIELARGKKESRRQVAALRAKWPVAFPEENQNVRPLSLGAAGVISAAMDWQLPYTRGVLSIWKMTSAYCEAVLRHDQRIALDGSPAEAVDANSRDLAAKRLAELAARGPAKALAQAEAPTAGIPKPSKSKPSISKPSTSKPSNPAEPKPSPARPAETPEQLRARVRASLLRPTA
jgi:sRNA-binding protein